MIACVAVGGIPSDIPFRKEYVLKPEYSIYEKIVCLSALMCTQVITTMEKRLISIMMRRGIHENTEYHLKEAYKLKKYFDDLLCYNLYDLFPEIKENL